MPSGKVVKIQGFENSAIDMLLKTYNEEDIVIEYSEMPEVWYFMEDGKYRRYLPDIFVPKDNLIVEVKSTYTYKLDAVQIDKKRKAVEYLGYKFKLTRLMCILKNI